MKAILLALLLIPLLPVAAATHDVCAAPTTCAYTNSYQNGDCSTTSGAESTANQLYVYHAGTPSEPWTYAFVEWRCSESFSSYRTESSYLGARGAANVPGATSMQWSVEWTYYRTPGPGHCYIQPTLSSPSIGVISPQRTPCPNNMPPPDPLLVLP